MKSKTQFVAVSLALVLVSVFWMARVSAQHTHDHGSDTNWKTGMLRISKSVWAGGFEQQR